MKNKAIIIGGTFNPITSAHINLAKICEKNFSDADIFFVPANLDFISNWKKIENDTTFSNNKRNQLLKIVFSKIKYNLLNIEVNGIVNGKTYDTVRYLKTFYKEIFVVIGADKLLEIEKWFNFSELLENVKFILFDRDGKNFDDLASDSLKMYSDRFVIFHQNDEFQNVSSSNIRKAFFNNNLESIKKYVPGDVYIFLEKEKNNV